MKKTRLSVNVSDENVKKQAIESLTALSGVMSADIVGSEAIVFCGDRLKSETLVETVNRCAGCSSTVIGEDYI
ncbi:MAG: hypothetical protein ACOX1Q_04020 [Eubacteriales bacterium]